jgi:hypothetical protein
MSLALVLAFPCIGMTATLDALLGRIAQKLGLVRAAKALATSLRGGPCTGSALWMAAADGSSAREIAGPGSFSAPVIAGGRVFAIRENAIWGFDLGGKAPATGPCRIDGDVPVTMVAAEEGSTLGVVTRTGKVVRLDPATCKSIPIDRLPSRKAEARKLTTELRAFATRCGTLEAVSVQVEEPALESQEIREEVYIKQVGEPDRNLTADSPHRVHFCPAFSADCKQVVFLAGHTPRRSR